MKITELKNPDDELVVHCTSLEELTSAIDLAGDHGFAFNTTDANSTWKEYGDQSCLRLFIRGETKHIRKGGLSFYEERDYTIIPAYEFVEQNSIDELVNDLDSKILAMEERIANEKA